MKNLVDYNLFAVNGIKLAIEPINFFLPAGGGAAVAGGDTVEPKVAVKIN